jgi:cellulose synthase/poly-beta-1,6-N-acetylglucosamine synthase-like glycosyltransferase
MIGIVSGVMLVVMAGILLLCGVLWLECLAAIAARATSLSRTLAMPATAILIPAHNEALGIRRTLTQLLTEVDDPTQIIVVADNCSDDTAAIAQELGVTVLERHNDQQRGKGYALDFGLQHLAPDPPAVVVMIDADCDVQPGTVKQIAAQAQGLNRPIQSLYLMEKPDHPQAKDAVSAFAFKVKNLVRPLGLWQGGQSCLLTGTGMAFPWEVIRTVNLASGEIVEDMKLGLDLAIAGHSPQFCPTTLVLGRLPSQAAAATSQRTRWEHGHLNTLTTFVPQLWAAGIQQGRLDLLTLGLELAVPPLSLLVVMWVGAMGISLGLWAVGWLWIWPVALGAIAGLLLLTAILAAWFKFGRQDLPALTLLSIPFYILWKIPLYFRFLVRPEAQWVRTERDAIAPDGESPPDQKP